MSLDSNFPRTVPSAYSFDAQAAIHHRVGRAYLAEVTDPPLSLKCMFNGQARYHLYGGREYIVDDANCLVLNEGTPYAIEKASRTPVETFCIFFPPWMLSTVLDGLLKDQGGLLDNPGLASAASHGFYEKTYSFAELDSRRIQALRKCSASGAMEALWAEQQIYLLLSDLLGIHESVEHRIARLPHARLSTRRELYRRIHWAVDYIHSCPQDTLSIARLASVAAMSPYHFLRSFRAITGLSPHDYVARYRLERACDLLRRERVSVTEIAGLVGFASLPSFISRFKSHFGMTPLQYRKKSNFR